MTWWGWLIFGVICTGCVGLVLWLVWGELTGDPRDDIIH